MDDADARPAAPSRSPARDSVTVSIAGAERAARCSRMLRVSRDVTSTCVGSTCECRGTEQDVVEA